MAEKGSINRRDALKNVTSVCSLPNITDFMAELLKSLAVVLNIIYYSPPSVEIISPGNTPPDPCPVTQQKFDDGLAQSSL